MLSDWLKAGTALIQLLVLIFKMAEAKRNEDVGAGKALALAIQELHDARDSLVDTAEKLRHDPTGGDPSRVRVDDGFKRKASP